MRFLANRNAVRRKFVIDTLLNTNAALSNHVLGQMLFDKFGASAGTPWLEDCRAAALRAQQEDAVKKLILSGRSASSEAKPPRCRINLKASSSDVVATPVAPVDPRFPPGLQEGLEGLDGLIAALRANYAFGEVSIKLNPEGVVSVRYELTPRSQQMRGELKVRS